MILLRRLSGPVFALNPDLIERAEATPDTVVTMVGGNKYVVCETLTELTDAILEHRARIIATAELLGVDTHPPTSSAGVSGSAARLHEVTHATQTGAAGPPSQPGHPGHTAATEHSAVVPIRSKDV